MRETIELAFAAREGGHVERCHTVPHTGSYSVGKHSFDAVSLLLLLHPGPSVALIKALLWHDLAERWVGDMPAPAKWYNPALSDEYEKAERTAMAGHGFAHLYSNLTMEDVNWLNAIDRLECYMWALDQLNIGNRNVEHFIPVLQAWFQKNSDAVPVPVLGFVEHVEWRRLKDV